MDICADQAVPATAPSGSMGAQFRMCGLRRGALRTGGDAAPAEYGATLRFYDPGIDAWRSTWHGPVRHVVMPFIGRRHGDEIVLDGSFAPGAATRWIFSQITSTTFRWRAEESDDGWKTSRMVQEMFATRQAA